MQKHLGKDIENKDDRRAFLMDNCDQVNTKGFMRRYTKEELDQKKTELSEVAITISEIELRKKAVGVLFKAELKPEQETMGELLQQIKQKAEFVTEDCFKFIDRTTMTVGFYSREGDLIEQRPALAEEMQTTIFMANRAASAE